jgi:hypothetical protein
MHHSKIVRLTSGMGPKGDLPPCYDMSDRPLTTDIGVHACWDNQVARCHGKTGPSYKRFTSTPLFRHVGLRWQHPTDSILGPRLRQAFELGRLLNWQHGRLRSFENLAGVDARLAIRLYNAASITHQSAGLELTSDFGN